jgi:structural maintenance of chromosome 3 (chondroitin sulfate proteoglycan 6)
MNTELIPSQLLKRKVKNLKLNSKVLNLLETAGFSSSNPFYIVEQGKVSLLTTMKDADRLNLLKEIAGTRIYDERRKESLKIMQNTTSKLDQINEVIVTVEERLKDLEKEKKEFKLYQNLDKERRSIEYTLYDKELSEAIEHLDQIEKSRHETHNTSSKLFAEKMNFDEDIQQMEKTLNGFQVELNDQKRTKDIFSDERQDLIKNKTQLELEIKDLEFNQTNESKTKVILYFFTFQDDAKNQMKLLKNRIKDAETKLKNINPKFEKIQKDENNIQEE